MAQPLCTALQLGILHIMTHWGIQPGVVVGHSSGEIAAACASGAITVESAIVVSFYRGKLAKLQEGSGAMASVGLSPEEVLPFLIDGVVVACENSPRNVTISGPKYKLAEVVNNITSALPGTFCRRLRVQVAYHSRKSIRYSRHSTLCCFVKIYIFISILTDFCSPDGNFRCPIRGLHSNIYKSCRTDATNDVYRNRGYDHRPFPTRGRVLASKPPVSCSLCEGNRCTSQGIYGGKPDIP